MYLGSLESLADLQKGQFKGLTLLPPDKSKLPEHTRIVLLTGSSESMCPICSFFKGERKLEPRENKEGPQGLIAGPVQSQGSYWCAYQADS